MRVSSAAVAVILPGGVEFLLLQQPLLRLPVGLLLVVLALLLLQLLVLGFQVFLHLLVTPLQLQAPQDTTRGGQVNTLHTRVLYMEKDGPGRPPGVLLPQPRSL